MFATYINLVQSSLAEVPILWKKIATSRRLPPLMLGVLMVAMDKEWRARYTGTTMSKKKGKNV